MKLQDVLLPECVLDFRGPQQVRMLYRKYLPHIVAIGADCSEGYGVDFDVPHHTLGELDEVLVQHLAMAHKYKIEKPGIYRFGKEFAEEMAAIDKDFPLDLMPDRFFGYISVPPNVLIDTNGDIIRGAFVCLAPWKETGIRPKEHTMLTDDRVLWITYDAYSPNDEVPSIGIMNAIIGDGVGSISSLFIEAPVTILGNLPASDSALRTFINMMLFITKGDEAFQDLVPPMRHMKAKERQKHLARLPIANMCTVPVTFVSWNYQKPREYNVDGSWRKTHPRWQPCGPGRTKLKLVHVRAHELHFKNVKEKKDEES